MSPEAIKLDGIASLKRCVNQFYKLAQFVMSLYGFHSCASPVQKWQEQLALYLQTKFKESDTEVYAPDSWISYKSAEDYTKSYKKQYTDLSFG